MVELEELRYVRLIADNLGTAADYAQGVLGLPLGFSGLHTCLRYG